MTAPTPRARARLGDAMPATVGGTFRTSQTSTPWAAPALSDCLRFCGVGWPAVEKCKDAYRNGRRQIVHVDWPPTTTTRGAATSSASALLRGRMRWTVVAPETIDPECCRVPDAPANARAQAPSRRRLPDDAYAP